MRFLERSGCGIQDFRDFGHGQGFLDKGMDTGIQ